MASLKSRGRKSFVWMNSSDGAWRRFLERMAAMFPDRIKKITHRLEVVRGGVLNSSRFFERQKGQGTYAEMLEQLFQTAKKKAGFTDEPGDPSPSTFTRPVPRQASLF